MVRYIDSREVYGYTMHFFPGFTRSHASSVASVMDTALLELSAIRASARRSTPPAMSNAAAAARLGGGGPRQVELKPFHCQGPAEVSDDATFVELCDRHLLLDFFITLTLTRAACITFPDLTSPGIHRPCLPHRRHVAIIPLSRRPTRSPRSVATIPFLPGWQGAVRAEPPRTGDAAVGGV
jgi:hypothetical protein